MKSTPKVLIESSTGREITLKDWQDQMKKNQEKQIELNKNRYK